MATIKCKNCKKKLIVPRCRIGIKKFCSMRCYAPYRLDHLVRSGKKSRWTKEKPFLGDKNSPKGAEHSHWKGDKVGYRGLHYWLHREKGKPQGCKCGRTGCRFQWANKDGKYRRNINDYISMCPSCHKKHDIKLKKKKQNGKKI